MGSNFGWFLVMLIIITFLAPFFMGGSVQKPLPTLRNIEIKLLKKAIRKAYAWYLIGATLYVAGILVVLPFIMLDWNAPRIARFEGDIFQPSVVFYNHFVLTGREFDIYFFVLPLFLLAAALGILRFEKSHKVIKQLEQRRKELS